MDQDVVIGFCVVYRWRIREGAEADFLDAWQQVTEELRVTGGGLGSRVHRSDEGFWVAYAQWPSRAAWENASVESAQGLAASRVMGELITERLDPILLDPVVDLLAPASGAR